MSHADTFSTDAACYNQHMHDKRKYFGRIYDIYVKQIFRFVYLRTNNVQITEDITSETFLRLWKKIQEGNQIDNERALFYMIARGIVIDYYRSKKRTSEIPLSSVAEEKLIDDHEILETVHKNQQLSTIYAKLTLLKKEYQEVIVLRFVEDLEYSEIASVLKKKEGAIRVLVHRAVEALKKHYE